MHNYQFLFLDLDNDINIDCIHVFFKILKYNWNVGWRECERAFTRGFKGLISFQLLRLINKLAILSSATRHTSSLLHHTCSFVSSSLSRYLAVRMAFFSFLLEGGGEIFKSGKRKHSQAWKMMQFSRHASYSAPESRV